MSIGDLTDVTVEDFIRIHQPLTELMTEDQKKAFNKELRATHNELTGVAAKRSSDRHGKDGG